MTREEAIEIVKTQYSHDSVMKTALEMLIPELQESKDERMAEMAIKAVRSPQAQSCIKSWGVDPDDVIAWLQKQKEHKSIKVYRVENEEKQKGLWRKFDGTWEPLFNMLTDGLCRNLPMEDNDLYRAEGKKWFASAPSRETLRKWFSKRDLEELTAAGFTISEFEVTNYKKVSEFEYIFTRDSIINRTYLTVSDIYHWKPSKQQMDALHEAVIRSCSHHYGVELLSLEIDLLNLK